MRKGYRFERELVDMLWNLGFAAVRVPGSGVMSKPAPDVIAGNGSRYLAIQIKMRSKLPLYFREKEVDDLVKFSKIFGAEPVLAVRLPYKGWKFLKPEMLKRTDKGYKVDEEVYGRGLDFDELLGGFRQRRLNEEF